MVFSNGYRGPLLRQSTSISYWIGAQQQACDAPSTPSSPRHGGKAP